MYLHFVKLNNLRHFKEQTFDFKPGFNLLVGENGTGKTTILRGVLAALGTSRNLTNDVKIKDSDIRLRNNYLNIEIEVHNADGKASNFGFLKKIGKMEGERSGKIKRPLTLFYSSSIAVSSAMRAKPIARGSDFHESSLSTEKYLYEAERDLLEKRNKTKGNRFGDSRSIRNFVSQVLSKFSSDMGEFYWRFIPYDCTLILPRGLEADSLLEAERLKKTARSFAMRWFEEADAFSKIPFIWPELAKITLSSLSLRDQDDHEELPNLKLIWDDMTKRTNLSASDYEILQFCSLEVKLNPRIMLQRANGIMSLDQLSDGEKRLFTLFVDIARQLSIKQRDKNNKFSADEAIILIDEIDVHLHPKWQKLIVPALEDLFQNCQFIATTHSPFVIQATNRDKIIAINPGDVDIPLDGGNSIEDIAEDIQGVTVPQRSMRAEKLSDAAKKYFKLLENNAENSKRVDPSVLRIAEQYYREASEPFTSNPAVHALLEILAKERNNS